MEVKADVHSITKLKDYFFIVPDYQREYVWKVDDQVEQFLEDIDNEFDSYAKEQSSYFIGSIIIVENGERFDVIDGQQRLTTIVLTLCALRDIMSKLELDSKYAPYLDELKKWLCNFDMATDSMQMRLELQYTESHDFLNKLIVSEMFTEESSASIKRMKGAYQRIKEHLELYLDTGVDVLVKFARYFLMNVELVVIESKNLSSALKIFETINQRGAGLNAMDLVKNLLFSEAREDEFQRIKEIWKGINKNLEACGEDQSPLRFLRYFLMARYYNGILREDQIYKWIISAEGKRITGYESRPLELARELERMSERYSKLVNATMHVKDCYEYPEVRRIGYINKNRSRQHLILLMALPENCGDELLKSLSSALESFFFYCVTARLQTKHYEAQFTRWAKKLRAVSTIQELGTVIEGTLLNYIAERFGDIRTAFLKISHWHYEPQYRLRFIMGAIEDTIQEKSGLPSQGIDFYNRLQIEHILPQTPKDRELTDEFEDFDDYQSYVYRFGNVGLLEPQINQAVNKYNNLNGDWFENKQKEYSNSNVTSTAMLNHEYGIGKNTQSNRFRVDYDYHFTDWNKASVEKRQKLLFGLALDTWKINGIRLDEVKKDAVEVSTTE